MKRLVASVLGAILGFAGHWAIAAQYRLHLWAGGEPEKWGGVVQ